MMMTSRIGNRGIDGRHWLTGNNMKRNFTFVEMMITVVILSIGLIFILQGISSSINATGLSQQITEACILAENKISELEMELFRGKGINLEERGENERLDWNYTIRDTEKPKLSELHFKVLNKRKREILEITTYLRTVK